MFIIIIYKYIIRYSNIIDEVKVGILVFVFPIPKISTGKYFTNVFD